MKDSPTKVQSSNISPYASFLRRHGMISGALYYQNLNETVERKASRAIKFHLQNCPLPQYQKGQIVFANHNHNINVLGEGDDANGFGMVVNMEGRCCVDTKKFFKLYELAKNDRERHIIHYIAENAQTMNSESANTRFSHGGLHTVVDLDFVLKNGLIGYQQQIKDSLMSATKQEDIMFCQAMSDVLEGLVCYIGRYASSLKKTYVDGGSCDEGLKKLIDAIEVVPIQPATSFYQAVISLSATMFLAGQFEAGRIDNLLIPYYQSDKAQGITSKAEAVELFKAIFADIDNRCGHPGTTHVTIGGTKPDSTHAYNELTDATMIAIRGFRAPNVTLRVRKDMPQEIWDTYLENMSNGYAQPAIVNEDLFVNGLVQQYNVPFEEAIDYAFGGCSEVVIQGKTMCDSTWTAYNMLDVLEQTIHNHLVDCNSFEEFYNVFKDEVSITIKDMIEQVNIRQHILGLHTPFPLLTLMTADCIKNRKSFTNGGARYNFDSTNLYGTTNTINSLYTIKMLYEGKFKMDRTDFVKMLSNNFEGYDKQKSQIDSIQKFGNYNKELNDLASDLMGTAFARIKDFRCFRGNGYFMPAIICWITWVHAGAKVGATPDGRYCSEPLCDSAAPTQGTDTQGPTATLSSLLAIPQSQCVGTCVVNLALMPQVFDTVDSRQKIKALFWTYFSEGGCHLQVNVVDTKVLQEAYENPDKHKNIIVRVGGFSDNFVMLDKQIQQQIILRTKHGM